MLKGIDPLLSPDLLQMLAAMGHGDEIVVVDANYPAEEHARRLVRLDGIPAPRVVEAILSLLPLDDFVDVAAYHMEVVGDPTARPPVLEEFSALVARVEPKVKIGALERFAFYDRAKTAYGIVSSGETRLYGNLILKKGVVRAA